MTNIHLTSSDEEIRLEIQKLDAEEQTHLAMAESSQKLLVEELNLVKKIGPQMQKAMEENNVDEMYEGLETFIGIFSNITNLISVHMNSLRDANEAKLWKDKYEFLLTIPEGE
ncbi:MAG: hypothetical protein ACO38Q_04250 [Aquiluna sp.]